MKKIIVKCSPWPVKLPNGTEIVKCEPRKEYEHLQWFMRADGAKLYEDEPDAKFVLHSQEWTLQA